MFYLRELRPDSVYLYTELEAVLGAAYQPLMDAAFDNTIKHLSKYGERWFRGSDIIDWLGKAEPLAQPVQPSRTTKLVRA